MKRILFALVCAFFISACTQIDTGNVGVQSTLGQVKSETLPPGMYETIFKTVVEACAKEVGLQVYDLLPKTADGLQMADMDVDIYYQINPNQAAKLRTKWPGDAAEVKDEGCLRLGNQFVQRQARETAYKAAAMFNSSVIHTKRSELSAFIVKDLQSSLDKDAGTALFVVSSVNIRNLVTDKAIEDNIRNASRQAFLLAEEQGKKEKAAIEADRKRIEAQGEADAIRVRAEAIAKQGGSDIVALEAIKKWDGKLPTTTGGVVPFVHVK